MFMTLILKKNLRNLTPAKMSNMKFWLLSICFLISTLLLSDVLEAQIDSPFICKPIEISKEKFKEVTKVLLTYPSINKCIKELSPDGNFLMYISNNTGFLLGIVFQLDSNYRVKGAYFTKFGNDVKSHQPIVPFKKKQINEFESLKIDALSLGQYLSCSFNALHEDREIVIILKETEINSGLYLRGNPMVTTDEKDNILLAFREKVRCMKVPKKLYYIK